MTTALIVSEVQVSACNGGCCENIYISNNDNDVERTTAQVQAYFRDGEERDGQRYTAIDAEYMLDMLIPISAPNERNRFSCRHFDPITRTCLSYETRPQMCRDFPYGDACHSCRVQAGSR